MDAKEFWALIDASRHGCEDDPDEQAWALEDALRERSREDLVAFERLYAEHLRRAERWELWGAGYVINGGMGDDSFHAFRHWLISRGRDVFERAVRNPDSLADVPEAVEDEICAERFGEAVYRAYRHAHGDELPRSPQAGDVEGDDWDEDDLPERFPRLWARAAW
jgi:hypothetical protein